MKKRLIVLAAALLLVVCLPSVTNAISDGGDPGPPSPGFRPPFGVNSIPLDGFISTNA